MSSRGRRGHGVGKLPEEVRMTRISKALSSTLRHNALNEGLQVQDDGYVNVTDLLAMPKFKNLQLDFVTLQKCVDDNAKQRFRMIRKPDPELGANSTFPETSTFAESSVAFNLQATPIENIEEDTNPDPKNYLIRATQGHSIQLESSLLMELVTTQNVPPVCVHGTFYPALTKIIEAGHLSSMTRTHIHFSPGLPRESIHPVSGELIPAVISGMRFDAEVAFFVDIEKAIADGYLFWRSDNGVILTEGKDGNKELPLDYVERVEDICGIAGGGNLWRRGEGKLKNWPNKSTGNGKHVRGEGKGGRGRGRGGGKQKVSLYMEGGLDTD